MNITPEQVAAGRLGVFFILAIIALWKGCDSSAFIGILSGLAVPTSQLMQAIFPSGK